MRPTQSPTSNGVLHPHPGMDGETCPAIPVTRSFGRDGTVAIVSYWEPTASERAAIAAGALVQLAVLSVEHPPVRLGVEGCMGSLQLVIRQGDPPTPDDAAR